MSMRTPAVPLPPPVPCLDSSIAPLHGTAPFWSNGVRDESIISTVPCSPWQATAMSCEHGSAKDLLPESKVLAGSSLRESSMANGGVQPIPPAMLPRLQTSMLNSAFASSPGFFDSAGSFIPFGSSTPNGCVQLMPPALQPELKTSVPIGTLAVAPESFHLAGSSSNGSLIPNSGVQLAYPAMQSQLMTSAQNGGIQFAPPAAMQPVNALGTGGPLAAAPEMDLVSSSAHSALLKASLSSQAAHQKLRQTRDTLHNENKQLQELVSRWQRAYEMLEKEHLEICAQTQESIDKQLEQLQAEKRLHLAELHKLQTENTALREENLALQKRENLLMEHSSVVYKHNERLRDLLVHAKDVASTQGTPASAHRDAPSPATSSRTLGPGEAIASVSDSALRRDCSRKFCRGQDEDVLKTAIEAIPALARQKDLNDTAQRVISESEQQIQCMDLQRPVSTLFPLRRIHSSDVGGEQKSAKSSTGMDMDLQQPASSRDSSFRRSPSSGVISEPKPVKSSMEELLQDLSSHEEALQLASKLCRRYDAVPQAPPMVAARAGSRQHTPTRTRPLPTNGFVTNVSAMPWQTSAVMAAGRNEMQVEVAQFGGDVSNQAVFLR